MNFFVKNKVSKNFKSEARRRAPITLAAALLLGLVASAPIRADDVNPPALAHAPVTVTTTAELIQTRLVNGHETVKLLPADRLVGADLVIYTLEVRNGGTVGVDGYAFTSPIPQHMSYVADSAVAPGAEVSYSVDGGRTFDAPENLTVHGPDGKERPAMAADYTHIRWVLKNRLKAGSMTLARFRATVIE